MRNDFLMYRISNSEILFVSGSFSHSCNQKTRRNHTLNDNFQRPFNAQSATLSQEFSRILAIILLVAVGFSAAVRQKGLCLWIHPSWLFLGRCHSEKWDRLISYTVLLPRKWFRVVLLRNCLPKLISQKKWHSRINWKDGWEGWDEGEQK